MKNYFDKLNSVIKIMSIIHDIYHHVLQTLAIKLDTKKETAHFNIYFYLWKICNNSKTQSENTMILHV